VIFVCVWVEANVPFTAEYVYRLRAMVQRHVWWAPRFVCLTDRPEQLAGVETVRIPKPSNMFGWWSKLELFNPAHKWSERGEKVMYLDLDVLIVRSLLPLINISVASSLTLIPHEGTFYGGNGKRVVHRYNSSVMTFVSGMHPELYTDWTRDVAIRLWGDQDWIGEKLPNQRTMPASWFPRISTIGADESKAAGAKIILCKSPKNHVAARLWPWVEKAWG